MSGTPTTFFLFEGLGDRRSILSAKNSETQVTLKSLKKMELRHDLLKSMTERKVESRETEWRHIQQNIALEPKLRELLAHAVQFADAQTLVALASAIQANHDYVTQRLKDFDSQNFL